MTIYALFSIKKVFVTFYLSKAKDLPVSKEKEIKVLKVYDMFGETFIRSDLAAKWPFHKVNMLKISPIVLLFLHSNELFHPHG